MRPGRFTARAEAADNRRRQDFLRRANSGPLAHAAAGIAQTGDATQPVPDRIDCGNHRVPWQRRTVFRLLATECTVIFDIVEVLSWILKERIVAGLVRVLELLVRTVFRAGLFGMLFPPIAASFCGSTPPLPSSLLPSAVSEPVCISPRLLAAP
jgi:hypothetical protein